MYDSGDLLYPAVGCLGERAAKSIWSARRLQLNRAVTVLTPNAGWPRR